MSIILPELQRVWELEEVSLIYQGLCRLSAFPPVLTVHARLCVGHKFSQAAEALLKSAHFGRVSFNIDPC